MKKNYDNFKIASIQIFMSIGQKRAFFVPASNLALFQTAIENACEENITVKTDSQIDCIELMKAPKEVKKQVETFIN